MYPLEAASSQTRRVQTATSFVVTTFMQHIEYAIEETFAKELRDKVYNILATTKNNKGDVQKKLDRILVTFGVTCAKSGIDPDRVDDQLIQTLRHGIRSLIG